MESKINFIDLGNDLMAEGGRGGGGGGGRLSSSVSLTRQPSIYSLTFDELQNSMGSFGKVGSMNMDELLKNIWTAEENQTIGPTSGGGGGGGGQVGSGNLQRQGSLTLPRTLSQKTVDEVWKDIAKDGSASVGGQSRMPRKEPTFGEMTLEDFLMKAGVVKEDTQLTEKGTDIGTFGNFSFTGNNLDLGFGYQNAGGNVGMNMMGNRIQEISNPTLVQSNNSPLNVNGVRSTTHSPRSQPHPQPQPQQQPPQLLPKQPVMPHRSHLGVTNGDQFSSPTTRGGRMNGNLIQNATMQGGGLGMVGLGAGVAAGSPVVSSDGVAKSNGDVSPVPYMMDGGLRGRRSGALEKVVERRQKRMIKNRESAARSRARKQAYTTELEEEVAKLKEENQELRKKLGELMEMQRNEVLEMMNEEHGSKRRRLRRTQTGPW